MKLLDVGQLVITTRALEALTDADINRALLRHQHGDWGNVSEDDKRLNDQAVTEGGGSQSVYTSPGGVAFWVITEGDQGATTVMLPDEY